MRWPLLRAVIALALVAAAGAVSPRPAVADGAATKGSPKLPPLKVTIDKSDVDLDAHRLEVRISRDPRRVQIKVFGQSGDLLADEEHDVSGKRAGEPLVVTWTPRSDEAVAKIEVFGFDAHGYYSGVRIVPWSLWIPHEEVTFETNSATIRASEEPKLEASLEKIRSAVEKHGDLGPISLFVVGHTDTVGTTEHNKTLSRRRARAIAGWFRAHGLSVPIAYAGFGESALKVKTEDEVDEPRNRRADYVLSIEEPRFKSGRRPEWARL